MYSLTLHKLYNPHQIPKELLIESFVIRTKEFEKIFNDIKKYNIKKSNQHFIIQGQRGVGKSTMLLRLKYEIEKLEDKIPILFDEEEYGITSLDEVWERVWEIINENRYLDIPNGELNYKVLENVLKEQKKILVLLVDNIGDLLENFDEENDEYILREILQKNKYIKLIGGSPHALEAYYSYEKPFYDFFNVITLGGLKYEETIHYLSSLGKTYKEKNIEYVIENNPKRIKILHILTGGNPRTIGLLLEIFANDKDGTVFQDLEKLLDSVTALYKHRMEELPKQQRKIVSAIALKWESVSVKELVELTKLESKVISAQLNKLVKNDVVEVVPTNTKNNLYCIKERFFNIWYLMRYKKKNGDKIRWLIEFMDVWYDDKELVERINSHIEKLKNNQYLASESVKMTEALGQLAKKRLDDNRLIYDLYMQNFTLLEKHNVYEEYVKDLSYNINDATILVSEVINSYSKERLNNIDDSELVNFEEVFIQILPYVFIESLKDNIPVPTNDLILKIRIFQEVEILVFSLSLLENNKFDFLFKFLMKFCTSLKDKDLVIPIFGGLLAKKQFNLLEKLLNENENLKNEFLPFYYFALKFNKENQELKKIPKELLGEDSIFSMNLNDFEKVYREYIEYFKKKWT